MDREEESTTTDRELTGSNNNNNNNVAAPTTTTKQKDSMQLLREGGGGHCEKLYCKSAEVFSRLLEFRDSVEQSTNAVLTFADNDEPTRRKRQMKKRNCWRVVEVGGSDECISAAVAMLHHQFGEDCAAATTDDVLKLDSEDSSYDSDYENSDPVCSPGGAEEDVDHDEVRRTVSDTLAAEFAEYVGTTGATTGDAPASSSYDDPTYTSRVEFALKLGYTERQVQIALQKLGPKPEQNELLAELIKLGATTPRDELVVQQQQQQQKIVVRSLSGAEDVEYEAGGVRDFKSDKQYPEPRPVVVDGSNVAMSHGNKEVFSCRGIKLCVDWFRARGHKEITVFVPMWRKEASRPDAIIRDQELLLDLEREGLLVFTPSRQMGGRRMACHDDRYILKLAAETDGIVVSNDNYRDLAAESPVFKKVIEERLLMFSFVNDRFMPPDDPLGRHGPALDSFLRVSQPCGGSRQQPAKVSELSTMACPYGKKCTYGNKCKYYHPERGTQPHKSVSEQLAEQAKIHIQEVKSRSTRILQDAEGQKLKAVISSPLPGASLKVPAAKMPLTRTKSLVPPPTTATTLPSWSSSFYGSGGDHLAVATRLSSSSSSEQQQQQQPKSDEESSSSASVTTSSTGSGAAASPLPNLHRKLERQLTFNPVYDPRLIHLTQVASGGAASAVGHVPLSRHSSAGASAATVVDMLRPQPSTSPRGIYSTSTNHQPVTRIASAPDSYRQWRPSMHHLQHLQKMMSTSDTQLHSVFQAAAVTLPPPPLPVDFNAPPPPPMAAAAFGYFQQQQQQFSPPQFANHHHHHHHQSMACYEEQRYRLYYHLSSLFPEDQVRMAMEKHPHETDPQEICAAIFAMFPKVSSSSVATSSSSSSSATTSPSPLSGNIPATFQ